MRRGWRRSPGEIDLVLDPPFQDVERLKTDKALTGVRQTADLGQQYFTFDQWHDELEGQRRQGPQSVQGPARAPRRVPGDQHRPHRAEGAARTGHADRRLPRQFAGASTAAWLSRQALRPYDPAKVKAPTGAFLAEAGIRTAFR